MLYVIYPIVLAALFQLILSIIVLMKIIVLLFLVKNLTYLIHKEFQVRGGNHSLCLVFLTQECTFFPQSPSQGTAAAPQAADSGTSGGATETRRSLVDDAVVSVISTVHLGMDPTD
jgi:hypothetical protein